MVAGPERGRTAESERELVGRCLSGDDRAWESFYDRYVRFIVYVARRALLRTTGEAAEADVEDVAAASFAALVARSSKVLRSFRWQCSLRSYLAKIVLSQARDLLRKRRPEVPLGEHEPALPAETDDAAAAREMVLTLPEPERRVVELFYLRRLSYGEIARELGCPEGTVATHLHRARARLAARFAGEKNPEF